MFESSSCFSLNVAMREVSSMECTFRAKDPRSLLSISELSRYDAYPVISDLIRVEIGEFLLFLFG